MVKYHPSLNYINLYEPMGRVCNWRANEASEALSGVYKFELVRYVYIYLITLIPRNITSQLQCISVTAAGTSAIPVTDE